MSIHTSGRSQDLIAVTKRFVGMETETPPKMHSFSTVVHIRVELSSSECKLHSQTETRRSLISGAETAEMSGGGKTDGGVFCQLSILPPSQGGTQR